MQDSRTRPAHAQMHGLVYRYDDPFWSVFYPPNGFNCRCTVIALNERDIERNNFVVGDGTGRVEEIDRQVNKNTVEKTRAFKLTNDVYLMADRGFDNNSARTVYKPNLDDYPTALAHQFAKREMGGESFKLDYQQFEKELVQFKQQHGIEGKLTAEHMVTVRNALRKEYKFAAGVLSEEDQRLIGANTKTVWLSDDTLIKQFNSRENDDFGIDNYANWPEIINNADTILSENSYIYNYKKIDGKGMLVVLKVLTNEIFIQSFRGINDKKWGQMIKNKTAVR